MNGTTASKMEVTAKEAGNERMLGSDDFAGYPLLVPAQRMTRSAALFWLCGSTSGSPQSYIAGHVLS